MQTENLIFTNWEARCSSFGKLMTNLPTEEEAEKREARIKELVNERDYGVNTKGNKVQWTENKKNKLVKLVNDREKGDELPTGAITELEEIFDDLFWGRKRILTNKYLTKGTINEEDALDLISQRDNFFYRKNELRMHNSFIQGTSDNLQKKIKDTKANWDLESHKKAYLTTIYEYQLKGYMWLAHSYDLPELETKTEAQLEYCLVNAPLHLIEDEKRKLWYAMGQPDEEDQEFREKIAQLERNMIFDVPKFKKDYPGYDFYNKKDFSMPPHVRVKSFVVTLTEDDIKHMTRRVTMARKWLVNKERETLKQIADGWQRNN